MVCWLCQKQQGICNPKNISPSFKGTKTSTYEIVQEAKQAGATICWVVLHLEFVFIIFFSSSCISQVLQILNVLWALLLMWHLSLCRVGGCKNLCYPSRMPSMGKGTKAKFILGKDYSKSGVFVVCHTFPHCISWDACSARPSFLCLYVVTRNSDFTRQILPDIPQ